MAHITALYAGILALLIVALAGRVTAIRRSAAVSLGDGGSELLVRRIRVHGNATENIPIGLLVMLVLELNQASATLLHGLGIALTVGRLAHAQGLSGSPGTSVGRFLGTVVSWGAIVWGAVALITGYFR
jgi:uncharacterized membrane protein YecN with MAPEG domain